MTIYKNQIGLEVDFPDNRIIDQKIIDLFIQSHMQPLFYADILLRIPQKEIDRGLEGRDVRELRREGRISELFERRKTYLPCIARPIIDYLTTKSRIFSDLSSLGHFPETWISAQVYPSDTAVLARDYNTGISKISPSAMLVASGKKAHSLERVL